MEKNNMAKAWDFKGWATRHNVKCGDGRTIKEGAFKDNDKQTVPLVWNHNHRDADNVLGHALLEYRKREYMHTEHLITLAKGKMLKN